MKTTNNDCVSIRGNLKKIFGRGETHMTVSEGPGLLLDFSCFLLEVIYFHNQSFLTEIIDCNQVVLLEISYCNSQNNLLEIIYCHKQKNYWRLYIATPKHLYIILPQLNIFTGDNRLPPNIFTGNQLLPQPNICTGDQVLQQPKQSLEINYCNKYNFLLHFYPLHDLSENINI